MEKIKQTLRDKPAARWTMMVIVSFLMAANYYFYDVLSPLKGELGRVLNISSTDYGTIVGFYAFPNTFLLMAIIGGIILDKLGIRITGTAFAVFMLIGAFLTVYGTTDYYRNGGIGYDLMDSFLTSYSPVMKMMTLGMLIFGLGAETSIVVTSKIIVKWFKGYEIALAFGLNLAIARIGSALAFVVTPALNVENFWNLPVWFSFMLLLIGFLAFLVYLMYDVKLDRQARDSVKIMDKEDEFHFSDFLQLLRNRSFWFITALCVTFYAAVFPFQKYAPDFFFHRFGLTEDTSSYIASILYWLTIVFTPFFGWVVDKYGRSATLMIYGSLMLVIIHLAFSFIEVEIGAYILMGLLGIAFSLVPAAMWPAVAKIVPQSRIGSAYGAMFSLQNLGLFGVPILAGYILDKVNPGVTPAMIEQGARFNYTPTMLMFVFFGVIGFIFALLLKWDDKTSGYGLELPSNETDDK